MICFHAFTKLNQFDTWQASMLKTINIFPYNSFFRLEGRSEVNHNCGGLATLAVLAILGLVLVMKLIELWSRKTVFFTSETSMALQPPSTILSTFQNEAKYQQFMLALTLDRGSLCPNVAYQAIARQVTITGAYGNPNRSISYNPINMEACTTAHFSLIPGMEAKLTDWQYNRWFCLPLNRTFEVRGDIKLSNLYKSLQFGYTCQQTCSDGTCGIPLIYQLTSLINTNTNDNPFEYFLKASLAMQHSQSYYYYQITVNENIMQTDTSLLPNQEIQSVKSISTNPIQLLEYSPNLIPGVTYIQLNRSPTTITVKKRYLKYLDVLSYVGGIAPAIIGIFFFINIFGVYFFEMFFSSQYFRNIKATNNGFLSFLRLSTFKILNALSFDPDWKTAKEQKRLRETVNKLLDIHYLYRRIEFLQRAVSMSFERHQLKGIHLVHSATVEETEDIYKRHQLRDQLILMLSKYLKRSENIRTESEGVQCKTQQKQTAAKDFYTIQLQTIKQKDKRKDGSSSEMIIDQLRQQHRKSQDRSELFIRKLISYLKNFSNQNQPIVSKEIEQEAEIIRSISQAQVNQKDLLTEIQQDIIRLAQEADSPHGDQRSKKIFERFDSWLKEALKDIGRQQHDLNKQNQNKGRSQHDLLRQS